MTEHMSWKTIRLIFGNGDLTQGRKCLEAIARRLIHARTKHPASEWAGKGDDYGLEVIEGEVRELRFAVRLETPQRVEDETLDVLATAVRKYNREDA
ncbi:hypothetical protein [uncultured Desulfovibrio sp.]|jgi:hypothetical protein|uniref:hypothetical protein n=1 Tax=uncultured Desulfovibrio sp. TaxID=167968 RepID=UPI0028043602|nr:hypothetical protein [uncultured Desulfovibrio sp.]